MSHNIRSPIPPLTRHVLGDGNILEAPLNDESHALHTKHAEHEAQYHASQQRVQEIMNLREQMSHMQAAHNQVVAELTAAPPPLYTD
jgi:hypothetical protein